MLLELKNKLDHEGYFVDYDEESQMLDISAQTGRPRPGTNESTSTYVARIALKDNKFEIAKVIIPNFKIWTVDTMQEVVEYLLSHRPNIPLGEENTWE